MISRPRVLIVVTRPPETGVRLASAEPSGLPPRDAALLATHLLHAGADVRVIDAGAEKIADRVVWREARLWRAAAAIVWAGGSRVAADPVPDEGPLAGVVARWPPGPAIVAAGPLAERYGGELLARLPRLSAALSGGVDAAWGRRFEIAALPGLLVRGEGGLRSTGPARPPDDLQACRPAWHLLPLAAYVPGEGGPLPVGLCSAEGRGREAATATLDLVRQAVSRAGAGRLVFEDRDFAADPERARRVARGMFGVAPGLSWTCRVRADRVRPMLALALAQGGCREILVTAPSGLDAPGETPMDDPDRPVIESAVEAVRATGASVVVEHVIGRIGHTLESLSAWHRWFHDRRIAVRPRVRRLHAGDKGPGRPNLKESRDSAGCWDNELRPRDVEKAVRAFAVRLRRAVRPA